MVFYNFNSNDLGVTPTYRSPTGWGRYRQSRVFRYSSPNKLGKAATAPLTQKNRKILTYSLKEIA